jgi:hypothetical protein
MFSVLFTTGKLFQSLKEPGLESPAQAMLPQNQGMIDRD